MRTDAPTDATVSTAAAPAPPRAAPRRRLRRLRRGLAAAVTPLALAGVTSCGGATDDFSATQRTLPNSVNVDAGPLALRHLRIDLSDAHLLQQGQIVFDVPVVRDCPLSTLSRSVAMKETGWPLP